jgi:hypothetical protein
MSTIKRGRTLRELKPDVYEPKSEFGKLIDNAVSRAIYSTKLKHYMNLMETLATRQDLVPYAQQEVEREFLEKFGKEKLISNPRIDKIFGGSIISKLSYLAKTNGVKREDVDNLIYQTVSNVLKSGG